MDANANWWRDAVIYQVYPRSFADSDGDGMGDVRGMISRLDYLRDLGVDALWISPFYASPLHDGGYDVADYRSVDPRLGSLDDMTELIEQAHARNLRVFMDIVPNHSSSDHEWFQEVLNSDPGSEAWDRYMIREGKGANHELPPNNWKSVFHGSGWSPLTDSQGNATPFWYLHLFDSTQPDFNWENEEVRAEFRDILRFWFDRGVDGFRIDVAHGMAKEAGLPDYDYADGEPELLGDQPHAPFWDQDAVHDIYREWRKVADEYDPPRVFCGETWVPNPERLARYQRPDELHTSFNFDYLQAGWDAEKMQSRSTTPSRTTPRSVRLPLGCSRITMSCATPRVWRPASITTLDLPVRSMPYAAFVVHVPPHSSLSPCPDRCTSTKVRSSACARSPNSTQPCDKILPGIAAAAPMAPAMAAGCQFRGREMQHPSDSIPALPAGCRSRPTGLRYRSPSRPGLRVRPLSSTAKPCACAAILQRWARGRWSGSTT